MDNSFSTADLKAILRFPFVTPRNKNNFFVGCLLMLGGMFVPILPTLVVYGYLAQIARAGINGEEPALPDWGDFGKLLKDGLRGGLIGLVYALPGIAVFLFGYVAYFAGIFGMMQSSFGSRGYTTESMLWFYGTAAVLMISIFVGTLLYLLGMVPLPVALANFVAKDKFSAGFELRNILGAIRKDMLGYFVAWLVLMGLFCAAYVLFFLLYATIIFCFVGILVIMPLAFYMMLVAAVLFGRFYRENKPA